MHKYEMLKVSEVTLIVGKFSSGNKKKIEKEVLCMTVLKWCA